MTRDSLLRSGIRQVFTNPVSLNPARSDVRLRVQTRSSPLFDKDRCRNIPTFIRLCMTLFACLLWEVHPKVIGQVPSPDMWQYRRSFVFENDLPSLGLEGFVPVPLEELEVLLQQTQSSQSRVQGSVIQSVVLVASLIGEDLVSEWSMVQFEKGGQNSTYEFQPLNLALRQASPLFRDSTAESKDPAFRSQPDGQVFVQPNEQGQFGFAWTLHGRSDLTGKSIQFQFDFPMSPQSTLILQLPPSWSVHATDHVVDRVGPDEKKILDTWAGASLLGAPQENLWVLQFGGSRRCSFQVQRIREASVARLPRVVASIDERFDASAAGLLLQSSWKLDDSTSLDDSLTVSLSHSVKVRSISWEGNPIPWRSSGDRTVLIEPLSSLNGSDPLNIDPGAPFRRTLTIEAVAPIPELSQSVFDQPFELPSIWIEGGYALQGISRILSRDDMSIVDFRSFSEESTAHRNVQGGWELHWRGLPKPRSAILRRNHQQAKAECLTLWKQLQNQMSCTSLVRVEGLLGPSGILPLQVSGLWAVDSILARASSTDQILGYSSSSDLGRIEIEYGNLEIGDPLVFELRYHFGLNEAEDGNFIVPQFPRLAIQDRAVEEVLGIETSENTRLKVAPMLLRSRRSRNELRDWQQREITSETVHRLFALSEPDYPEITFLSQPSLFSTSTDVTVVRQRNRFECNYRIRCAIEGGGLPRLQAELPNAGQATVRWSQLWQQTELPIQSLLVQKGTETTNEVWQLFPLQLEGSSIEMMARIELEVGERVSVPVISFPLAANQTATVSIDESLKLAKDFDPLRFLLRSTSDDPHLSIGGTHFELDPARSHSFELEYTSHPRESRFFGEQFIRYELLTSGEIRARSHWRLNTLSLDPIRLDLPAGWRLRQVWIDGVQAQPRFDPLEMNRVYVPIQASSAWSGVAELEVEYERERVQHRPQYLDLGVPTIEARGLTVRGELWLPPGISESGNRSDSWTNLADFLQFWKWHRQLWSKPVAVSSPFSSDGIRQAEAPVFLPQRPLDNSDSENIQPGLDSNSKEQSVTSRSVAPMVFPVRLEYEIVELALRWVVLLICMSSGAVLRVRNWAWFFLVPISCVGLSLVLDSRSLRIVEVGCLGYLLGWALTIGRTLFARHHASALPTAVQTSASGIRGGSNSFARVSIFVLAASICGSSVLAQSPTPPDHLPSMTRPMEGTLPTPTEKPTEEPKATVFDLLIPMDAAGNLAGRVGYIPQNVYDRLIGDRRATARSASYEIASARYQVNFSNSMLELSPPTMSLHYELNVLDSSNSIAFPVRSSEARWTRFVVDDREVLPGFRLSQTGDQLVWQPDQVGRVRIRIDVIPRVGTIDMQSSLKVSVPRVASAQIDVVAESVASLQIVSKGQVLNPQVGRYLAHLGPVDAIELTWTSKDRERLESRSADSTIDTWLKLSESQVEAYTRIVVQQNRASPSIIDVECLSEWQPLGTVWGSARLLETSLGSSLARRRYRLLVDSVSASSSESPQEVVILTRWIPANESAVNLGVPLVDVVSRRIANRVLAIASTESSEWQIQGIASWPQASRPVVEPPSDWQSQNESFQLLQLPENTPSPILRRVKKEERTQFRPAIEYAISSSSVEGRIELPLSELPRAHRELRLQIAKGATSIRAELDGRVQPHVIQTHLEGYDELMVSVADRISTSRLHLVVQWPVRWSEWSPLPIVRPLNGEIAEGRYSIVSKLDIHVQFENLPNGPPPQRSMRWEQWEKVHHEWIDFTRGAEARFDADQSTSPQESQLDAPIQIDKIQYRVQPSSFPVLGSILTRITRSESSWNIDYVIDIETEEKRYAAFLEVPASLLTSLDADCPFHVVSASSESKAYIAIQPYEMGANRYRCRVVGQLTNTELESSVLPIIDVLGAQDVAQRIIVPSRIGNQAANWKGSGVRLYSAEEFGDSLRLEKDEVAYVATTSAAQLRLASLDAISMQKQEVVANYRISPSPTQVAVDCEFWVYSAGKHFIQIEFPSRFQLLGLRVNNRIMAETERIDNRLRLSLPMSELPSLIRLVGIVRRTHNDPFRDHLAIPTISESSTMSFLQIQTLRSEDSLVTSPTAELERTMFRDWQSSRLDRLQAMLSRGRIQFMDPTSAEGSSWRKIWFPVLARLGAGNPTALEKLEVTSEKRSLDSIGVERSTEWTNEIPFSLLGYSGAFVEEQPNSFLIAEGSIGELQIRRSLPSESHAWIAIAMCILASILIMIASFATTPGLREYAMRHPWTFYVVVGMLLLLLLPWKWIGGSVMMLAAMAMLQTIHHRRTRRVSHAT